MELAYKLLDVYFGIYRVEEDTKLVTQTLQSTRATEIGVYSANYKHNKMVIINEISIK